MRLTMTAVLLAGLGIATAASAENVIQQRQALMKQMGEQAKIGADMAKGKVPFDAAKAALVFKTFQDNMKGYAGLFPPGSDVGETKAKAEIWSDRAGFEAAVGKFEKLAADNAAAGATEAGFKTAFSAVGDGCRACHQSYKNR